MKRLATLALLAALALPSISVGSPQRGWQWEYKKWMPPVWQRIAHCEGGTRPWWPPPKNEPDWAHNSGTYQGALGFHRDSWDRFNRFGYPREAYLATPWQQYKVALAIYNYRNYRFSGWGCYDDPWVRYG